MEMTPAYLAETVDQLARRGWEVQWQPLRQERGRCLIYEGDRYRCTAGAERALVFEALSYPDGSTRYYLEIERYYQLAAFSFPLDSWKYRDEHVELKFEAHPETGLGLAFTLAYSARGAVDEA